MIRGPHIILDYWTQPTFTKYLYEYKWYYLYNSPVKSYTIVEKNIVLFKKIKLQIKLTIEVLNRDKLELFSLNKKRPITSYNLLLVKDCPLWEPIKTLNFLLTNQKTGLYPLWFYTRKGYIYLQFWSTLIFDNNSDFLECILLRSWHSIHKILEKITQISN